jgi:cell wall assembly regulator SMI1
VVEFTKTTGPLTEQELAEFENSLPVVLPSDYRRFLQTYDGGRPKPRAFSFYEDDNGSSIHSFYGIKQDEYRDIRDAIETYKGRIPERFLPIAYDEGGNRICLSLYGDDRGYVYFWDHELEADETQGFTPETTNNLTLISKSFTDFLNSLREVGL